MLTLRRMLAAMSVAGVAGQALIGIPSANAMELMADAIGIAATGSIGSDAPERRRGPLADYYRTQRECRASCVLRPL